MATKKLTSAAVRRYRAGAKRRTIPDGRGLYLVVQPTGSKSWCMFFRGTGGKMVKLTLGPLDESGKEAAADPVIGAPLSLAGARRLAANIHHMRATGQDVMGQRLREKAELRAAAGNTFAAAAKDFIREHSMRKVRGWREQARLLGLKPSEDGLSEIPRGLADRWRDRPIGAINGHDIHRLVDDVRKRGIPGLARRGNVSESRARHAFACLSKMFSWLVQQRRIETNPCSNVHRPDASEKRERVLSDGEIAKLWTATEKLGAPFGPVIRLLLLTGCRLNEIAGLRWEEVAEDGAAITIPGSRTKNHRDHVVSLSKPAQAILAKVGRVPESPFAFTTTGTTPISGWSKTKGRLDQLMGDVPPWRIHDIRRTVATGMARAGVDLPVIERALNHVSGSFGGIVGVYQKHKYADEVRAALDAWADLLLTIVEGRPPKVVPITGGRRS
jgi:integrase